MGLTGTLHRISAIKDRDGSVIGLTYRIGRHVPGTPPLLSFATDVCLKLINRKIIMFLLRSASSASLATVHSRQQQAFVLIQQEACMHIAQDPA